MSNCINTLFFSIKLLKLNLWQMLGFDKAPGFDMSSLTSHMVSILNPFQPWFCKCSKIKTTIKEREDMLF